MFFFFNFSLEKKTIKKKKIASFFYHWINPYFLHIILSLTVKKNEGKESMKSQETFPRESAAIFTSSSSSSSSHYFELNSKNEWRKRVHEKPRDLSLLQYFLPLPLPLLIIITTS
jgi:hypothetical protein